jgi:chromosome segregation ATPase
LGVLYQENNAQAEDALRRLRRLYDGNFSFLRLVNEHCQAAIFEANTNSAADEVSRYNCLPAFGDTIAEYRQRCQSAQHEIETLDAERNQLREQLREQTQNREHFEQQANLRGQHLHELEAMIRLRDQRVQELEATAFCQNARLQEREETILQGVRQLQDRMRQLQQKEITIQELLRSVYDREVMIFDLRGQLSAIQTSFSYRFSRLLQRTRRRLAPEGSWRFRLFRKSLRAGGQLRSEGISRFLVRLGRKCLPFRGRAA